MGPSADRIVASGLPLLDRPGPDSGPGPDWTRTARTKAATIDRWHGQGPKAFTHLPAAKPDNQPTSRSFIAGPLAIDILDVPGKTSSMAPRSLPVRDDLR